MGGGGWGGGGGGGGERGRGGAVAGERAGVVAVVNGRRRREIARQSSARASVRRLIRHAPASRLSAGKFTGPWQAGDHDRRRAGPYSQIGRTVTPGVTRW